MREIDLRRTLMGKAKAENCISRTCLRIMAAKLILFAPATLYLVNLSPKDTRRQQQQNAMHQADATRDVFGSGALPLFI